MTLVGGRDWNQLLPFLWMAAGLFVAEQTAQSDGSRPVVAVAIRDHRFSPSEIHVKAGEPAFLEVVNLDAEAEEFEMRQLAIEKLIVGGRKGQVRLRPLGPGRYPFLGEFHPDTAQGAVVAE